MKRLAHVFIVSWLLLTQSVRAGDYPVATISPLLMKNANAVVRLEELRFEVINTTKAVYKNHYVITILDETGDQWAQFSTYYDKHQKIESVEGFLYDASGKQIRKVKTRDMEDISGVSDESLMDDNRLKVHNFYHRSYPYTVEYTVEMTYNSTMFFPGWVPQGNQKLAVEKSSLTVVCPKDYQFRYKAFNYHGTPVITQEGTRVITTWSVQQVPAILREAFAPQWHELTTLVLLGPTHFQIDDYKGNMMNWLDFGKFVQALKQGKDVLPDNIKKQVRDIVATTTHPREQVALLYRYLQKNTRYISIQLGIGGWQPFDATFVSTKAYGDCKALTNYMYSLLKEAGIKSYYTLVRAGQGDGYFTTDFPSSQFNHVILCVPQEKDTIWLECTSSTAAPGYMGSFTGNRSALLIDEDGGHLVQTPRYSMNDNVQVRKVRAELNTEGTLHVQANSKYSAIQQDDIHGLINTHSREKVKEYLQEQLDFSTYEINRFDYKEEQTSLPTIDETLDITVSNYATVTGKRIFINPNIMTRSSAKLTPDPDRKYAIVLGTAYRDVDTIEIVLPAGYAIESKPQDIRVKSKFGEYSSSVIIEGNKLFYCRSLANFSGRFPASDFAELVQFYDSIHRADRSRVVLVKSETVSNGL